jgi:hypothetical protein
MVVRVESVFHQKDEKRIEVVPRKAALSSSVRTKGVYFKRSDMDIRQIIRSQYLAALEMLEQAVVKCPNSDWNAAQDKNKFWHLAYHALFYIHLYLQETVAEFTPWEKHQDGLQRPGSAGENAPAAFDREEILAYLAICQAVVEEKTRLLDLEAPSGFDWLPFNKLELQFYNIRHLQQHVGELYERLGRGGQVDLEWVSWCPDASA